MLSVTIAPQYVRYTQARETFPDGKSYPLHRVQASLKRGYEQMPRCTILTAPTGTGKSYAFPFPALREKAKDHFYRRSKRTLIVLPTNALIEELHQNFTKTYPQLTVAMLTGPELTRQGHTGFARFTALLNTVATHDLIITNPDLLNYALHGGYHQRRDTFLRSIGQYGTAKTGGREMARFLEYLGLVIFDEYHLYDEAQIANLLTLMQMSELWLSDHHDTRYLFASATPEPALQALLEARGYAVETLVEEIVDDPAQARAIHGELSVYLDSVEDVRAWLDQQMSRLDAWLSSGHRGLIILDKLDQVQALGKRLQARFPQVGIFLSTGYQTKQTDREAEERALAAAQLIIATNKAEVGVNYGVTHCLMQSGRHFANFVQRFGRVARGDQSGEIHVALNPKQVAWRRLNKSWSSGARMRYYDFLDGMRAVMQKRKFYQEWVPDFEGEYLWCIHRQIQDHQSYEQRGYLRQRLHDIGFHEAEAYARQRQRYYLMERIDQRVKQIGATLTGDQPNEKGYMTLRLGQLLSNKRLRPGLLHHTWVKWWRSYQDSYLTFRNASVVVEVRDQWLNIEVDYSLEWLLQYREILDVEQADATHADAPQRLIYHVGPLKERDTDLQYRVATIPSAGEKRNQLLSFRQVNQAKELRNAFAQAVKRLEDRYRKDLSREQPHVMALLKDLNLLANTFSRKRLEIVEVIGNERFL